MSLFVLLFVSLFVLLFVSLFVLLFVSLFVLLFVSLFVLLFVSLFVLLSTLSLSLRRSSSLMIVLGKVIHCFFLIHLFWKASSLCAILAVSFQQSELFKSILKKLLL